MTWSEEDLAHLDAAQELEVAVRRDDGTLRRWTPVWVVTADGEVYVRSWWRRGTGWYGAALRSCAARVRVPGLEADVTVEDVGAASDEVTRAVVEAYRASYGGGAASMVTPGAAATTLRLARAPAGDVGGRA